MSESVKKVQKPTVHFLHIGKTGGTAVMSALAQHLETPKYIIKRHNHVTTLKDIPRGDYVVFFLRDPISRFVSGFYSRQRKGHPRYHSEWSPKEKKLFEMFDSPNRLACALSDEASEQYPFARSAMNTIQHLRRFRKWYETFIYFESRIDDILYIGFQESLHDDFNELKKILELPESSALPDDDVRAHKGPQGLDRSIDENGVAALQKWYADDYKFISMCREIMSKKRLPL